MEPLKSSAGISPQSETDGGDALCPRCSNKLTNPESLGWCPSRCCRSVEQDKVGGATLTSSGARKPSALGIVEFLELIVNMPRWLKVLMLGVVAIVAASFSSEFLLPEGEPFPCVFGYNPTRRVSCSSCSPSSGP